MRTTVSLKFKYELNLFSASAPDCSNNYYPPTIPLFCEYDDWLTTSSVDVEDEAARFCKYGFGCPHRESPMDPDQAHLNAVYYTRVKLKCMFGVDDPEQYSKDLIISAWKVLQFSQHYDRVASLILIGEDLSGADHVNCTVQEMIDAMNSDATAYRDPWTVALNLRLVWEEAHNTPPTKRYNANKGDGESQI